MLSLPSSFSPLSGQQQESNDCHAAPDSGFARPGQAPDRSLALGNSRVSTNLPHGEGGIGHAHSHTIIIVKISLQCEKRKENSRLEALWELASFLINTSMKLLTGIQIQINACNIKYIK